MAAANLLNGNIKIVPDVTYGVSDRSYTLRLHPEYFVDVIALRSPLRALYHHDMYLLLQEVMANSMLPGATSANKWYSMSNAVFSTPVCDQNTFMDVVTIIHKWRFTRYCMDNTTPYRNRELLNFLLENECDEWALFHDPRPDIFYCLQAAKAAPDVNVMGIMDKVCDYTLLCGYKIRFSQQEVVLLWFDLRTQDFFTLNVYKDLYTPVTAGHAFTHFMAYVMERVPGDYTGKVRYED